MNRRRSPISLLAGPPIALILAGCIGVPDIDAPVAFDAGNPERSAAVAEMRAQAAAGEHLPYPDAFEAAQTTRLAARAEPLTVAEVEAVETELALIAKRRALATDPAEIAALEQRARELRRLALRSGSQPVLR